MLADAYNLFHILADRYLGAKGSFQGDPFLRVKMAVA
jgi:hypothetical protein